MPLDLSRLKPPEETPALDLSRLQKPDTVPVGQGEFGSTDNSRADLPVGNSFSDYFEGGKLKPQPTRTQRADQKQIDNAVVQLNFARGDVENEAAVVRNVFGDDATIEFDKDGRALVTIPKLGVEREFINAPGISKRDLGQFGTSAALAALPAAKIAKLGSATLRILGGATAAGGEVIAQDAALGATGADVDIDLQDASIAAVLGGFLEGVGAPAVKAIATKLRNSEGVVTPALERALERAGVDAGQLNPEQIKVLMKLADLQPERIAEALNSNVRAEFNISGTKAGLTQNTADASFEHFARSRNPVLFEGIDAETEQSVQNAVTRLQSDLAPDGRPLRPRTTPEGGGAAIMAAKLEDGPKQANLGGVVRGGLVTKRDQLQARISQAYEPLKASKARLDGDSFLDFAESQRQTMLRESADLSAGRAIHANTRETIEFLEDVAANIKFFRKQSGNFGVAIPVQQLENVRRRIGSAKRRAYKAGEDADGRLLTILNDNFDQYVTDAMTQGMFSGEGVDEVLKSLKKGRALNAAMRRTFRDTETAAGRIIDQISSGRKSDSETIRALLGTAQVGGKEVSEAVIRRVVKVVGRQSPEFQALRESVFNQILEPKGTGRTLDRATFIRDAHEAMNNSASGIMRELFSVEERKQLNRFVLALSTTLPEELARGGPRMAARVTEGVRGFAGRYAQRLTFRGKAGEAAAFRLMFKFLEERYVFGKVTGAISKSSIIADALRPAAISSAVNVSGDDAQ